MIRGKLCSHIAGLTILEPTRDHSLVNNMEFEGEVARGRGESLDELRFVLQGSRVDLGLELVRRP
jgi:hypothetical protein